MIEFLGGDFKCEQTARGKINKGAGYWVVIDNDGDYMEAIPTTWFSNGYGKWAVSTVESCRLVKGL